MAYPCQSCLNFELITSLFFLCQVEALLDRIDDQPPVMAYVVQQIMELGYTSWAYRVVAAAGGCHLAKSSS